MLISGLLLAISVLLILWKMPNLNRKAMGHPVASDITISVGVLLLGLFTATFSGMMTGVIAGIFLSMYLLVGRKLFRSERYIKGEWREIPPEPVIKRLQLPKREQLTLLEKFDREWERRNPPRLTFEEALKEIRGE